MGLIIIAVDPDNKRQMALDFKDKRLIALNPQSRLPLQALNAGHLAMTIPRPLVLNPGVLRNVLLTMASSPFSSHSQLSSVGSAFLVSVHVSGILKTVFLLLLGEAGAKSPSAFLSFLQLVQLTLAMMKSAAGKETGLKRSLYRDIIMPS